MGKKEAVSFLQDQTLRYPMTKVAASHLSAVWNTLIERLDVSEIFSVGFWFLELVGKDATRDLGLCHSFVGIYHKYSSQFTSVAKELYKKIILGFPAGYQECLWLLSSAFTSAPLDPDQVTLYVGRLLKLGLEDLFVARALTALLRLGVLERTARKSLMNKILKCDSMTDIHMRLVGAVLVNGCGESAPFIALTVRKYLVRTKNLAIIQGFSSVLPRLSKDLAFNILVEFLRPSDKTGASSYFTDYLISTADLELIVEAILERLGSSGEPFDATLLLGYAMRPEVLRPWCRLAQTGRLAFALPLDCYDTLLAPESIQSVAELFKASFKLEQDVMSALSRTFASAKTAQVLQESFESRLVLFDAALEAIAEIQSDPLFCPFSTLERIHEWACQINCSSLFPSIYRLHPGLFDASVLQSMEVSEQVECLYSVARAGRHDAVRPSVTNMLLSGQDKCKVAYLLSQYAPDLASPEFIFSAMAQDMNSEDILMLFSNLLTDNASAIPILSKFALVPKAGRNDLLFLEALITVVKFFASSKLPEKDSIFVLETVQDLLLSYFAEPDHMDLVVSAMSSLCCLGDRRFRSDLLASLIAKVVEGRHSISSSTYIRVLAAIPGSEPITVIGILTSLAKDRVTVAVESLASFIMERSQEIESLLPEVAGLLWTLVNERCSAPLGRLCLALAEALGTDLASTNLVQQQVLVKVVCSCLEEQVGIYGTSSDTDNLLSTCTRIILLTKSFVRPGLLLVAISHRLSSDRPSIALDCFRWLMEFCPDHGTAFESVFPHLLRIPDVPLDLVLLFKSMDRFVDRLMDQNPPVPLLTRLIPRLDLPSLPSSSLQDLTMRSFQRAMESLSSKDSYLICLDGLSLAESLIDTLNSIPDDHNPSALTPYQPLIFTIFGLATGNPNPLVRSYGYLVLCRLCSVDFYGLGVAEHPRIDRLLSSALTELSPDFPDRVIELSQAIMTAAWSYILLHPRFSTKFPLINGEDFIERLNSVVSRTKAGISKDYSFEGTDLVYGYQLGIRCALALQHLRGPSMKCTAAALMGASVDSLRLLLNSDLGVIPGGELVAYLYSYQELSMEYLDLALKLPSGHHLILSKIDIDLHGYTDEFLFALFDYLTAAPSNHVVILALLAGLLQSGTPSRVPLQCLKSVLPHFTERGDYERLIGIFLASKDLSGVSLQLLAYALTFHADGLHFSPSMIKSSIDCLMRNIEIAPAIDCAILILLKAQSLELRRAVAVKILPRLALTESRKKLLVPALQDIL